MDLKEQVVGTIKAGESSQREIFERRAKDIDGSMILPPKRRREGFPCAKVRTGEDARDMAQVPQLVKRRGQWRWSKLSAWKAKVPDGRVMGHA